MIQPLRTVAVKRLLEAWTHPDLAALYNPNMELQCTVDQDGGERVEGDYKGRQWHGWTDGTTTWKSFRIPMGANSEPHYVDRQMTFDLAAHALGIGMTGWDWVERCSRWVGFDFDAITGHSERHQGKLTDAQLVEVEKAAREIPWVTTRRSTSGKGLHLYVFLNAFPTSNHTEHQAVARAILGMMSGHVGYDFKAKVDVCGGNMWVWHRKMLGTPGLTLIKQGESLNDIPPNWRDHIKVVSGQRRRTLPEFIENSPLPNAEDVFEELTGQRANIPLDDEHKRVITWLRESNAAAWWDSDHHMLVTHTIHLRDCHEALGLRGMFKTESRHSSEQNCFGGSTEVLTSQGPKKFQDAVGTQRLYVRTDRGFEWMDCEIRSFGFQKTVPIYFGDGSQCRTTANHQWLFRDGNHGGRVSLGNKKFTYELVLGKTQLPLSPITLPLADDDYWRGYAHGFVFGDGWEQRNKDHSKETTEVALFKRDVDLKRLLLRYGTLGSHYNEGHGYVDVIRNLPAHWKGLPRNPSRSYALGFVLGFGSADGNVNDGFRIFQSDWNDLEDIRRMAVFAGLRTNPLRPYGDGSGFENGKQGYACTINTYNLATEHFLRTDQAAALTIREKNQATTVSWIDWEAAEREEVFCAVVPHWQNFTLANGVNTSNCFLFPLRKGAWTVRRYTPGVKEDPSWDQDASGYTRCYFNREPDLFTAARSNGGLEHPSGGYHFREAEQAQKAALALGANLNLPPFMMSRNTRLKQHKDGRLIAEITQESSDNPEKMEGWIQEGKNWKRVFNVQASTPTAAEVGNYDDIVRHLVTETDEDYGWVLKSDNNWRIEPWVHVKTALRSFGLSDKETTGVLGSSVFRPWVMVNRPFDSEYPGDRQWNRGAAQLRFQATIDRDALKFPTWSKILEHVGKGLNDAIRENGWARANGILTGADYLKCWIASLFQAAGEPLPYLFLYSEEQNTGKSILHEALSVLVTHGVTRADMALISQSGFNGELENAILCVVEETDLKRHKVAYNRIKDWVTSRLLPIHKKGRTPYSIPNTTHWIQCANDHGACPVFSGDTRITMIRVEPLEPTELIPKKIMLPLLEKEAPDFLADVLALEIPSSGDRLNVPVIMTDEKKILQESNQTYLQMFLRENTHYVTGEMIPVGEFYDRFLETIDPQFIHEWSKVKTGREMPPQYPKGRNNKGQWCWGNISWHPIKPGEPIKPRLAARGEMLVSISEAAKA